MVITDFHEILAVHVRRAGGCVAFAKQIGISPAMVSGVTRGKKTPSKLILDAIGYERVVTYQPKQKWEP